jgi:hypothetical protein
MSPRILDLPIYCSISSRIVVSLVVGSGFVGLGVPVAGGVLMSFHKSLPRIGHGARSVFSLWDFVCSCKSHINCFSFVHFSGGSSKCTVAADGWFVAACTLGPGGRPVCVILCAPGGGGSMCPIATDLGGRAHP